MGWEDLLSHAATILVLLVVILLVMFAPNLRHFSDKAKQPSEEALMEWRELQKIKEELEKQQEN